jgi:hypothetical protein
MFVGPAESVSFEGKDRPKRLGDPCLKWERIRGRLLNVDNPERL